MGPSQVQFSCLGLERRTDKIEGFEVFTRKQLLLFG